MSVIKFFNFILDVFPIIVTVLIILSLIGTVVYQLFQIWALQKENSANEKAIESLFGSNRIKLTEAYAERDAIKIHLDAAYETINELRAVNSDINKSNDELIEKMLATDKVRDNLIKCIERTGIRDSKGIVRKVKEGEIQSVISGNHLILKPKPFKKYRSKLKVKLPISSVTSLSDNECIEVNSDYERDEILRLMDEAGVKRKTKAEDIHYPYPYCLSVGVSQPNNFGYSERSFYEFENFTILPASDFIQPKKIEPNTAVGRDWGLLQPFPKEYRIPLQTEVFTIPSDKYPCQSKGVVNASYCIGDHFAHTIVHHLGGRLCDLTADYLCPVHAEDHPEHP